MSHHDGMRLILWAFHRNEQSYHINVNVVAGAASSRIYFCRFFFNSNEHQPQKWLEMSESYFKFWISNEKLLAKHSFHIWKEKKKKLNWTNEDDTDIIHISFCRAGIINQPTNTATISSSRCNIEFSMLNPFTMSNTHITRPNSINVKWLDMRA